MRCLSAPFQMALSVTGKCNLRCKHCDANDTWQKEDLSTAELLELIDQIGAAKVFTVGIYGGEPLMQKDLFLLLDRLNRYPIRLSMNTNATLMTPEIARELAARRVKDYIVSLDGDREAHERMRGKGSFDKAIEGIRCIKRAGAHLTLYFTVTKLNIGDLERVAELGRELGVDRVRYSYLFYGGNALANVKELYVSPLEDLEVCRRVHALSEKYGSLITGTFLEKYRLMQEAGKKKVTKQRFVKVPPCPAGLKSCVVRPDGWVVPCELLWNIKSENVRKKRFVDIWKSAKVLREFREPMKIDLSGSPECMECAYRTLCFAGHRCFPFHLPKGLESKEMYCLKLAGASLRDGGGL